MENVSKISLLKDYLLRMRPALTGEALSSFAAHLKEKYSLDSILEREKDQANGEKTGAMEHEISKAAFTLEFGI